MIEEPPLLLVHSNRNRPSDQQLAALQDVPTGFLTDAMNGRGALGPEIRPLSPDVLPSKMCGVALTCLCGPADLLAVLGALTEVQAGDVLVAATGDWRQSAVIGDRVLGMLNNAEAIGFITDGLVRDIEGIKPIGMPVYCTGLSPNSPYAKGPGEIGGRVQISGVSINSGDVIVSDDSGVVVIPLEMIDDVIDAVKHIKALELELDARVTAGLKVPDEIRELMKSDQVKRI